MRIVSLCVAAGIAAVAAAAPAQAAYHLIRWQDTGFCQIWDQNIPTVPYPSNYTTLPNTMVPTFYDALLLKDSLLRSGTCSF